MHTHRLDDWAHQHTFGQDRVREGERRTLIVCALTAVTMAIEIAAGIAFGSMALLADGLHMASHAAALGIAVFAYAYTRRFAADSRYSFGTGKVNALAGFASALLLALFAVGLAIECFERMIHPVAIAFDQAIAVAVFGLLVNGASVLILSAPRRRHHDHDHHDHEHHGHDHHGHGGDHNLRGAYLHVLADSLTSLLAIFALLMARSFGWVWIDPAIGVIGAAMILRWSSGLLSDTSSVLLDRQAPQAVMDHLRASLESGEGDRVADLHVWSVGPDIYAADISLVSHDPQPPDHYKRMIPETLGIVHVTLEVHRCAVPAGLDDAC